MENWEVVSLVTAGALGLLFLVMAIFLLRGKGAWLIAGYNTMSKEKRDQYDKAALCKFMGRVLLVIAFVVPGLMTAATFQVWWLTYFLTGLFVAFIVAVLIYANTGERFKK